MKGKWVEPDVRDNVVDFIKHWQRRTEFPVTRLIKWLGLETSKYYAWKERYGRVNEHNGSIPRDHWLTDEEKGSIFEYYEKYPESGYRRLTYMMIDANIVAVSPTSVYRVLKAEGLLKRYWGIKGKLKGTGFNQPLKAHEHWHVDICYINICGTFYYLFTILDGYSRAVINWGIGEQMREADVEIILEQAREKYLGAKPRIISDNGPQFISKDFKEYIRLSGMTQVRTSPYHPQSNGKIERWHKSLKMESIRQRVPLSLEDAKRIITDFIKEYNERRLHSAIGYVTPIAKLEGREIQIWKERERKLSDAREKRATARQRKRTDKNIKMRLSENLSLSVSR